MSTQRILLLSYLLLGLTVSMVLGHLIAASLGSIDALEFLRRSVFGTDEFWSLALGFALGIGGTVWCWVDNRVKGPAVQVVEELQRVTWPTLHETRTATFAVIVTSIICAILLGVFDYGWGAVTSHIYASP